MIDIPERPQRLSIIDTLQKMMFEDLSIKDIKVFYHFLTVSHRKNTNFVDIHDKSFFQYDYISNSDCFGSIDKLIESQMLEKITDTEYKVIWKFKFC